MHVSRPFSIDFDRGLLRRLGLDRTLLVSAAPYRRAAHARGEGCQIDLLIQTRRTVWVAEIKRRREIGREVIDEVAEKVKRLGLGRRVSVRTALVYSGHLSPAVESDGFFDAVVDVADIMSERTTLAEEANGR